ncbi:Uncharacterised protein [Mycobacteroides abscessus subsp. abscessus]|nr:Uncharacterised protein [Mycobacteroides abscessus subsp. abscessus]
MPIAESITLEPALWSMGIAIAPATAPDAPSLRVDPRSNSLRCPIAIWSPWIPALVPAANVPLMRAPASALIASRLIRREAAACIRRWIAYRIPCVITTSVAATAAAPSAGAPTLPNAIEAASAIRVAANITRFAIYISFANSISVAQFSTASARCSNCETITSIDVSPDSNSL